MAAHAEHTTAYGLPSASTDRRSSQPAAARAGAAQVKPPRLASRVPRAPTPPTPSKFPPRTELPARDRRAGTPAKPMATTLTPTQRYAAGALLALALRQAQIHQSAPLGSGSTDPGPDDEERASSASGSSSSTATISSGSDTASGADLWTHDSRGLLRPVFRCRVAKLGVAARVLRSVTSALCCRFLEIEPMAWAGIEETAASPDAKHHIGAVRPFHPTRSCYLCSPTYSSSSLGAGHCRGARFGGSGVPFRPPFMLVVVVFKPTPHQIATKSLLLSHPMISLQSDSNFSANAVNISNHFTPRFCSFLGYSLRKTARALRTGWSRSSPWRKQWM